LTHAFNWQTASTDHYVVFDDELQHALYVLSEDIINYDSIELNKHNQYFIQLSYSDNFSYNNIDESQILNDNLNYKLLMIVTDINVFKDINDWCDATKENLILSIVHVLNKDYKSATNVGKDLKDYHYEVVVEYSFEDYNTYEQFKKIFSAYIYWDNRGKLKKSNTNYKIEELKRYCLHRHIRLLNILQDEIMDVIWINGFYHKLSKMSDIPTVIYNSIDAGHCNTSKLKEINKETLIIKGDLVLNDCRNLHLKINKLHVENTISIFYCTIKTLPKNIITDKLIIGNDIIPPLNTITADTIDLSDLQTIVINGTATCKTLTLFECGLFRKYKTFNISKIMVSDTLTIHEMRADTYLPDVPYLNNFTLSNFNNNKPNPYVVYLANDIVIDKMILEGVINWEIFDKITILSSLTIDIIAKNEIPLKYMKKFESVISYK
jgi:hypothetical protein